MEKIINKVKPGDSVTIAVRYMFDTEYKYREAIISKVNKSSIYFQYENGDYEWRADKYGYIERVMFGATHTMLIGENAVEEHMAMIKEQREFSDKIEFVKQNIHVLAKEEIESIHDMIKGRI